MSVNYILIVIPLQFPLRRYLDLVHGSLISDNQGPPQCVEASLRSLKWGVFYCLVVALIVPLYPNSYLFTSDFTVSSQLFSLPPNNAPVLSIINSVNSQYVRRQQLLSQR